MCTEGGIGSRVSIKDIARAAGVSHPTVSRALRGDPRISAETAERIRDLSNEMGYSPSAVARGLRTRRTRAVGLVVTTIADPFVADVVDGVEHTALEHGYSLILATSRSDPERELAVVRLLDERRVDGVIVAASRLGALYEPHLATMGLPIVLINNQAESEYLYSVSIDDIKGAFIAVSHLARVGHRAIGYVGCPARPRSHQHRQQGYRQALARAGLAPCRRWLVVDDGIADDVERGMLGMRRLLSIEERPTAVFCYNDMTAVGALNEVKRWGLGVPDDVSLAGFDDIREASLVTPPLTTIRQPRFAMGQEAMTMLLRLLDGEAVHNVVFPPRLIPRGSVSSPADG